MAKTKNKQEKSKKPKKKLSQTKQKKPKVKIKEIKSDIKIREEKEPKKTEVRIDPRKLENVISMSRFRLRPDAISLETKHPVAAPLEITIKETPVRPVKKAPAEQKPADIEKENLRMSYAGDTYNSAAYLLNEEYETASAQQPEPQQPSHIPDSIEEKKKRTF
jgi:hypothetical protein